MSYQDSLEASSSIISQNFLYVFDENDQVIVAADVYQVITLSNNGPLDGWLHTAGSETLTCKQTGLYMVTYGGQGSEGSIGLVGDSMVIRMLNTGVEVVESKTILSLEPASTNDALTFSAAFLVNISFDDTITFEWTASVAENFLAAMTGSGAPYLAPSFRVTIIRIR